MLRWGSDGGCHPSRGLGHFDLGCCRLVGKVVGRVEVNWAVRGRAEDPVMTMCSLVICIISFIHKVSLQIRHRQVFPHHDQLNHLTAVHQVEAQRRHPLAILSLTWQVGSLQSGKSEPRLILPGGAVGKRAVQQGA